MSNEVCKNLLWLDLEMTGLNFQQDVILEIAVLATNEQLEPLDNGIELVISQPTEKLALMNSHVRGLHTASGLVERVVASTTTLAQAQVSVMHYMQQWCAAKTSPLCGNSVWQDRQFLRSYMPQVDDYFHYRIIDVSTIKELVRRWYVGKNGAIFEKKNTHRAMQDVHESIAELLHYKKYFFI